MRRIQSIGDLHRKLKNDLELQWLAIDTVLERGALKQFHGNEVLSAFTPNVVDCADVRMVQSRRRSCLPLETFQR